MLNAPSCLPSDLLSDFTNSRLSLLDIATKHHLSLTDLTLLLARPDIADQLAAIHSAAAQRTRIAAAQHLPLAVEVLASIAATHRDEDHAPGFDPANPRHRIFRLRHRESARRAASTLLHLANYAPRPPAPVGTPALVGRTSCPPALAAPSHAHDEVGSATESWRCPPPALAVPSRATQERGPASTAAPSKTRPDPTPPLCHSATSPLLATLLTRSGRAPPRHNRAPP